MNVKKVAHKLKSARKPATKMAMIGTAAAAAASLAMGSAPPASAAPLYIDQQVLTAGPLVNLLPALGITSVGPISLGAIPIYAPDGAFLTLQLSPIAFDTQNIYTTVNALPFKRRTGFAGFNADYFDRVYSLTGATAGQFPAILGSGIGTGNTVQAYRTQIATVLNNGAAPNGYTPYQPSAINNVPNQTNQVLLLLRNAYRPNGGLQARFAPLLNLFGVDTAMPGPGFVTSPNGQIRLNTGTVDLTWAYDPIADFPVTLNPFAIANSLLAGLPTNLVGGLDQSIGDPSGIVFTNANGDVTNLTGLGLSVASVLGILNRIAGSSLGIGVDEGRAFYGALVPNDLPLLEPLRLPSRLINAVFGTDLGTPFADALQPAFEILVNTGYSDVITPNNLDSCAVKCDTADAQTYAQLGYSAYDRSFLTPSVAEPFLSVNPLTPAEWLQVPGDVVRALFTGFSDVFFPPAPATPPASVLPSLAPPVSAARTLAAAEAQPAVVVDDVAAPDPAPVAAPRTAVPTPVVSARKARGTALRAPAAGNVIAPEAAESRDDAATATAGQSRDAATPTRAVRSAARAAD
jgi:hypothetical protein